MSEGEFFLISGSCVLAALTWITWYRALITVNRLGERGRTRQVLAVLPVAGLVLIYIAILRFAAHDVRDDPRYIAMYTALGAAWIGILWNVSPLLGISMRDDVLERRNRAAMWPVAAIVISASLLYAGGNAGEGPGYQAVLGSAGMASASWLALWGIYELFTSAAEKIAVERNVAAGARLAALLTANALVLAAAASGDWVEGQVLKGFFHSAAGAAGLTAAAIIIDRRTRRAWPGFVYLLAGMVAGLFALVGQ